ncbi:MAG: methyltransferase domain-containing protein [Actinomycetia bacterium]|nr:methyltransferase domain-containing protein [Actinomycetes bacterium]
MDTEDHQESEGKPGHHFPDGHSDGHGEHGHGHGHEGWFHQLRYLKHAPRLWTAPINEALVKLIAPGPGERVLDVGAGMGPAVLAASALVGDGRVFAVDPSPLMRGIMRFRRTSRRLGDRVVVFKGKAEDLPLESASIDAAWSINCVHHWGDDEKACRELGRVVSPGGRLVLLDEQFSDPTHPRHDFYDSSRRGQPGFFHEIDTDRLARLLEEAGFGIDRCGDERVGGAPVKLVWAVRRSDATDS